MAGDSIEGVREVEAVLKALANRRRLVMLAALERNRGMHVGALAEALRLPMKTVSRHLRLLERAGLVLSDRRGAFVCYRMDPGTPRLARVAIDAVRQTTGPRRRRPGL